MSLIEKKHMMHMDKKKQLLRTLRTTALGVAALCAMSCAPMDDGNWTKNVGLTIRWDAVSVTGARPAGIGRMRVTLYPRNASQGQQSFSLEGDRLEADMPTGLYAVLAMPEEHAQWLKGTDMQATTRLVLPTEKDDRGETRITELPNEQIYAGFNGNVHGDYDHRTEGSVLMRAALHRVRLDIRVLDGREYDGAVSLMMTGLPISMDVSTMKVDTRDRGYVLAEAGRAGNARQEAGGVMTPYASELLVFAFAGQNSLELTLRRDGKDMTMTIDLSGLLHNALPAEATVAVTADLRTGKIEAALERTGLEEIHIN